MFSIFAPMLADKLSSMLLQIALKVTWPVVWGCSASLIWKVKWRSLKNYQYFNVCEIFCQEYVTAALKNNPGWTTLRLAEYLWIIPFYRGSVFMKGTIILSTGSKKMQIIIPFGQDQLSQSQTYQWWSDWRSCKRFLRRHCGCCCWLHGLREEQRHIHKIYMTLFI